MNLLLLIVFGLDGPFLSYVHVMSDFEVLLVTSPFFHKLLHLEQFLLHDLCFQICFEVVLGFSHFLEVVGHHVLGFLRAVVGLVVLLVDALLDHAFGSVVLYLFSQVAQVLKVVMLLHLFIVLLNDVLFSLLPPKLVFLKDFCVFNVLAFVLKPFQSLII